MTKLDTLVAIRASEEIAEHGSVRLAIAAVDRQIATSDISAERRFMRRVHGYLWHVLSLELGAQL